MKDCKVKLDETQKQLDEMKKKSTDVETEVITFSFDFETTLSTQTIN